MANYNLKIIDNKVIFDGHAENQSDCHTLTLLCNLLEKNTKTIVYKMGYAEFELDDLPSENKFWFTDTKTFSINGTIVQVLAVQKIGEEDAFIPADSLSINLSFSQEGVSVHNVGTLQAQAQLVSELDLNSYFSSTSIPSIAPGGTALFPFLDNIRLISIVSNDGQNISEGDIISENGTKLTVSKINKTISDKLQDLIDIKQAIKEAIENKGVDMTGVPFTEYADKIDEIETGGGGDN